MHNHNIVLSYEMMSMRLGHRHDEVESAVCFLCPDHETACLLSQRVTLFVGKISRNHGRG